MTTQRSLGLVKLSGRAHSRPDRPRDSLRAATPPARRTSSGFTIIEIIIAVAVLALLAGIVIAILSNSGATESRCQELRAKAASQIDDCKQSVAVNDVNAALSCLTKANEKVEELRRAGCLGTPDILTSIRAKVIELNGLIESLSGSISDEDLAALREAVPKLPD